MFNNPNLNKFFEKVYKSGKLDKKRDLATDLSDLLVICNTKYEAQIPKKIPDKPTIILSNHYVRNIFTRRSLFTTFDSMITSAIIAKEVKKVSKRQITAAVKNDLRTNVLFLSVKNRKLQLAAIDTYDLMGISKKYPFGDKAKWQKAIEEGKNILAYPEGTVTRKFKKIKPNLISLIKFLTSQNLDFQVLPVAIYHQKGKFVVHIANEVNTNQKPQKVVKESIKNIASNLPKNLKGYYANGI